MQTQPAAAAEPPFTLGTSAEWNVPGWPLGRAKPPITTGKEAVLRQAPRVPRLTFMRRLNEQRDSRC